MSIESNPYERPTPPTPRTRTGRGPGLIFGLWLICCKILFTIYGDSPTWFWASWASLAAIFAGVWVGRHINKRRAGLFIVPVQALVMVGASSIPPANATVYP